MEGTFPWPMKMPNDVCKYMNAAYPKYTAMVQVGEQQVLKALSRLNAKDSGNDEYVRSENIQVWDNNVKCTKTQNQTFFNTRTLSEVGKYFVGKIIEMVVDHI